MKREYQDDLTKSIAELVEANGTTKEEIVAVLKYMEENIRAGMMRPSAKKLYDEYEDCLWSAYDEIARAQIIIEQMNEMENIAR